MEHPIRILGIAPYEGMCTAMKNVAEDYPDLHLDAYTGDLEAGAELVRRYENESYDAIVSRGGTAELIAQVTELPVISIPITVYDILRVIKMAENYSKLYAIVGFATITEPAHTLCDLLNYDADIITVRSAAEVAPTLERLRQGGYRMIISDMVAHTAARQMGFDAFLITSGTESIRQSLEQAMDVSRTYRRMRRENLLLRTLVQDMEHRVVVLDEGGDVSVCSYENESPSLLAELRAQCPRVPAKHALRLYHTQGDELYEITARRIAHGSEQYYLFRYRPYQISLHLAHTGIRFLTKEACHALFLSSFFSISGAMGPIEEQLRNLAAVQQPVLILGEVGTGKEQIARALYLRSDRTAETFVSIDCAALTDKSWSFLLDHEASPLNHSSGMVYFQNFEALPPQRLNALLAAIHDTNLARRVRLLFSCLCTEEQPLFPAAAALTERFGCPTLQLPPLRSRSDEISSLASLYLANLNAELGKQIIGFVPQAMELLRRYRWPNNFTQFKQVLYELATMTTSSYIRSGTVSEVLAREKSLRHVSAHADDDAPRTLEQITLDAVQAAVEAADGNQSLAARRLGISRSTLWRYLNKPAAAELPDD